MKSVVFQEPYKAVLTEKEKPIAQNGEILLRMLCVGVCGTDMQVFKGLNKFMKFPVVPFHEGIALVEEISEGISGLKVGDLVTVNPIISCGSCHCCKSGGENACENFKCLGVQVDGLGDEFVTVERKYVHKISNEMNLDEAILIEPFAVGVHAARRGNVAGKNVIVIGAGTIGNFVAQASKLLGAKCVAICDISEEKVEIARKAKIDRPINSLNKPLGEVVELAFRGEGVDVIIDCVGLKRMLPEILQTAPKKSTLVIVGNYSEPVEIDVTKIQRNELNVFGSITYTQDDFRTAIGFFEDKKVYTEGYITNKYPLSDIQAGMEHAVQFKGLNMKSVFEFK